MCRSARPRPGRPDPEGRSGDGGAGGPRAPHRSGTLRIVTAVDARPAAGGAPPTDPVPRLVRAGVALAVVAVVVQTVSHVGNAVVLDGRLGLATADGDTTAWSWASAAATGAVALLLALRRLVLGGAAPLEWVGVAGLAFLSQDDTNAYHERLSTVYRAVPWLPDHSGRLVWPLLFLPLLALVLLVLVRTARALRPPARRLVEVGLGLLVAAVVLEMTSVVLVNLVEDPDDWRRLLQVAVEEGLELAGWVLVATAAAVGVVDAARGRAPVG